jgi:hypothetical protein
MLCFTATAFLELDVIRTAKNSFARVSRVRDIKTLLYLKRKKNFDNYVCFAFGKKATKLYQDQEIEFRYFLIPSVDELIEKLMELMVVNGATISNNTILHETKQQREPDVGRVPQAPLPTKSEKNELLKRIGELESMIDDTLDYNHVQELVACYGKATEIFSQDPNSEFMIFTVKTQSLLARPDIQAVLDSNRNVPLLDMDFSDSTSQKPTQGQPSEETMCEKSRFKFTGSDEEDEEDLKKESKQANKGPSKTKEELDFLSLDISSQSKPLSSVIPEKTQSHASPQKGVDLLSLETLAFEDSGKKTANKLIKRKKQGDEESASKQKDQPTELDLLSINEPEKLPPQSTPDKNHSSGAVPFEGNNPDYNLFKLDRHKSASSSKKLGGTPTVVRKDSYSDDENKFVIG